MTAVYLGIMAMGVAIVVFLFVFDGMKSKKTVVEAEPPEGNPSIFNRPTADDQTHSGSISSQSKLPPEPEYLPQTTAKKQPDESQALLEENLQKTAELEELQAKYAKLDKLLTEKNEEFDKKSKELENEIKNRKEFNKVKDLLEKEIKDLRDKNHKQQLELTAAKTEAENLNKRAVLLDEKISSKEKDIKEKEKQIDELVKRMQTFATKPPGPPPSSATTIVKPTQIEIEKSIEPENTQLAQTVQEVVQPKTEPPDVTQDQEPLKPEIDKTTVIIIPPSEIPPAMPATPTIPERPESISTDPELKEPVPPEPILEIISPTEEEQPHLNLDLLKLPDEGILNLDTDEKKPEKIDPPIKPAQKPSELKPTDEDTAKP